MELIAHRINTLSLLESLDQEYGAEIDIRYHEDQLVLTHDPFQHHKQKLITLKEFLERWTRNRTLILNVKSEGIERECINLMNEYKVKKWFFLDLSMPFFVKYSKYAKERSISGFSSANLAVRFSDKEPIEYALNFKNQAEWVWVDWFDSIALTQRNFQMLKENNFKICLVSPELQAKDLNEIEEYKQYLKSKLLYVDAVCTKRPDLWK